VVHALFARLAESHPLPAGEALAESEWRDSAARLLRREGVPAGELAEATGIVVTAVARTLSDARGRWILGGQHHEAASELALTGLAEGRLRAVVIDRSFVDESGTRWVIDYKTSRHEGGGLEDFLAEELERYRGQLSTYVALARQLGPQPVRAALYFPLLSAFQELERGA
jgi:ATP-dependent exoDNAse (exonuclease V) beta subunit